MTSSRRVLFVTALLILFGGFSISQQQTDSPQGRKPLLCISHLSENHISFLDPATRQVVGMIDAGHGTASTALSSRGVGYVANYTSGTITVFDCRDGKTVATVAAGTQPCFVALSPDETTLLISHQSNDGLWFMHTGTDSIVQKLGEGTGPFTISADKKNVYQAQIFSPYVFAIDPVRRTIFKKFFTGGRPMAGAPSPDGLFLYVANMDSQSIQKIDLRTDSICGVIRNVPHPRDLALSPDGRTAFAASVIERSLTVVDLVAMTVAKSIPLREMPVAIALDPEARYAYVACQFANRLAVVDLKEGVRVGSIPVDGNPIQLTFTSSLYPSAFTSTKRIPEIQHAPDSLNTILLRTLRTKKFLLIGDGYHHHGAFMRITTDMLSRWVDALEASRNETHAGQALPHKLALFLESDSAHLADRLNAVRDNNIAPWLASSIRDETEWGHLPGGMSVDLLENAAALHDLTRRIQRLNAAAGSPEYDLQIIGPEGVPPYKPFDRVQTRDTSEIRKRRMEFERTKFLWFAHERDGITASSIAAFFTSHPDYKGVGFFGTGHLLRGKRNKADLGGRQAGIDTAYDYFLASLLDRQFGRNNVAVLFTNTADAQDSAQLREQAALTGVDTTSDFTYSCPLVPPAPTPLEMLPCRANIDAARRLVSQSLAEGSEHGAMFGRSYAFRLYMFLKRSPLNNMPSARMMLDSIRAHLRDTSTAQSAERLRLMDSLSSQYDPIATIDSVPNWLTLVGTDSLMYGEILDQLIADIPGADDAGIRPRIHFPVDSTRRTFLSSHWNDIREYLFVNLLWAGSPDERSRAIHRLTTLSGQTFADALGWSEWWRKRYQR